MTRSRHSFAAKASPWLQLSETQPNFGPMHRLLSSLLVALALFFMPLAASGGMAMAHAADVEAPAMAAHCADQDQPGESQQDSKMRAHCLAACAAAVAAVPGHMPQR